MKYLFFIVAACLTIACIPDNYPVTYPAGSILCRTDYDCLESQYCGFMPGYTAAICRG